jgi:hypothetical protein
MATWSGWQNEFLNRANIIVTPPNRDLLDSWAKNAHTDCTNNPIDLSHQLAGATNCGTLPGIFAHAKHYTSHAQAATAFNDEIHAAFARALLDAMNTGNPYQVSNASDVGSVFVSWGSDKMLNVYLNAAAAGGPGAPPPGGSGSTDIHHGWNSVRRSLNKNWPHSLNTSERNVHAALRSLSHSRKVKH